MDKNIVVEELVQEDERHFPLDAENGLTSEQVQQRIDEGLVNKIQKHVSKSYWKIITDNLLNFFNILLITISILMVIAEIEITAFAFLFILILNIAIGLYQDIHARHLVDRLRVVSYPTVQVLRDGKVSEIPANQLVLSDIVMVEVGSQLVCDGTVVKGTAEVNESMLTGESIGVLKEKGSKIYSGSYVTTGRCYYRVEKLGRENYAEQLQTKAKEFKRAKSEILNTLNYIFRILAIIVIVLGAAIFISTISKGNLKYPDVMEGSEFQKTIRAISGSMVSMIPTGMYLLTSVTLAIGVIRLASHRVLVQSMYSIEMLARSDVLCLDKTGTITDGTMNVKQMVTLSNVSEEEVRRMLHTLIDATGDNNSTANAILCSYSDSKVFEFYNEIPFNSDRKFSAVMLSDGRNVVMGAREFLGCHDEEINKKCAEFERQGLRVLLVGYTTKEVRIDGDLPKLKFLAIIVIEDHIREDAYEIINWFNENDVSIRVISGDNPLCVSEIAKRAGVIGAEKFISLDGMSLDDVRLIANKYTVFGRVNPEQKQVLVEALQDEGHTVAMTGDGVNDILALKVADCSIAMASGTDATKNTAQLVSLDSNFASLPKVVAEGRRVINNLQRTCTLFLTKTFFAVFMTLIFFVVGLVKITERTFINYPFITNSMYIWELFTIGIGSFFLSIQPNEERLKDSFITNILKRTIPAGLVQLTIPLIFFIINLANPTILSADPNMSYATAITLSIIGFSVGSLIVFVRTCWPFDKYRAGLVVAILLLVAFVVWFDIDVIVEEGLLKSSESKSFFCIDYELLTSDNWWILLLVCVLSAPYLIGLEYIANVVVQKLAAKNEKFRGVINEDLKRSPKGAKR